MVQIRRLTGAEMQEAVRLSDATFRDDDQTSMGQLFPFLFSDAAMHLSYGAFEEDGKLVSFMGVVLWTVRIGEAALRVASLGSVCTETSARGKGYASLLLEKVQSFTREAGASLLLVSGDRSLYTRAGCALFGKISRYRMNGLQAESLLGNSGMKNEIREMRPDDWFAVQEAAETRMVRYQLGVNEFGTLLKAEAIASVMRMSQRVLVEESDGKISSFAIIGVSSETNPNGAVLEYGGDSDAVVRLFVEAVGRYGLQSLEIPIPWHEKDIQAQLSSIPSTLENQPGTVCILSGEALIDQLSPWLEKHAGATGLQLTRKENSFWQLKDATDRPPVDLSEEELIGLIFGRAGTEDVTLPSLVQVYQEIFPIPFPYTAGLCFI
ncbi:Acetyltransferase (GNAT) domain-containing protein [Paenibacillus catalpae]|uniref:Acetyltransferase (GNAT) domain-containing protein n=1 Tax=Paenibacillus catalpae TaxID=1045775 RepID=A0A1I1VAD8_9BACL|nr:GNAT family N-acetyltransferase [Paenibacillus catalpae]SFD79936.1 Acetyltransferase (GNAT) domain-containing protein [Paenibacillus catalpae]